MCGLFSSGDQGVQSGLLAAVQAHGLNVDRSSGDNLGAVLGVEVVQVGLMLEVVGVNFAAVNNQVGLDVVVEFLHFEGDVLGSQDVLGNGQDLGMGGGRSSHGDGGAGQSGVIDSGVIAIAGFGNDGHDSAGVLIGDEISNLLAAQRGNQSQGSRSGLVAFLDAQDVAVGGEGAFDQQGISNGVQAVADGEVVVDNGVISSSMASMWSIQ